MRFRKAELALRDNSPEIRHGQFRRGESPIYSQSPVAAGQVRVQKKSFSTAEGQYRERSASGFPP
jgi:hypothetical protein